MSATGRPAAWACACENGVFAGLCAENISYGYDDARDVVRQLIIDSRVAGPRASPQHLHRSYSVVGVACAGTASGARCASWTSPGR
jgi:hypothetical protein